MLPGSVLSLLVGGSLAWAPEPPPAKAPPIDVETPDTDLDNAPRPESPNEDPSTEATGEVQEPEPTSDNPSDAPEPTTSEPEQPVDSPTDPSRDDAAQALEHLNRAQTLAAAGDLTSAEAEVSVAIALQPNDGAAYLERAQIRMSLADANKDNDSSARRSRAALLRDAANDVAEYLTHADLDADSRAWFEARQQTLRRDADALDPPPELIPEPEPEPTLRVTPEPEPPAEPDRDPGPHRASAGLLSTGAIFSAGGVGLAAGGLRITRSCTEQSLCGIEWDTRPELLGPAVALSALGTTALIVGTLQAPRLAEPRHRRRVVISTVVVGSAAAIAGTVLGGLVGARWASPLSPSDTPAISTTQTLANASASSFAVALPLIGTGLTAWLRHRRNTPGSLAARIAGR